MNERIPGEGEIVYEDGNPDLTEVPIEEQDDAQELSDQDIEALKERKFSEKALNALGLYSKDQFAAQEKRARDNRDAFQNLNRQMNERMRALADQVESLKSHKEVESAPSSDELWQKYAESGDVNDLRAARQAEKAETDARLKDAIRTATSELRNQQDGDRAAQEWAKALSKKDNEDLDYEDVQNYLTKNNRSSADETIFFYRSRKWLEAHPDKTFGDYVQTLANNQARFNKPKGTTLPVDQGNRRSGVPQQPNGYVSRSDAVRMFRS